jgi:WD40 repeat protein
MVAYSPDGESLASVGSDGNIKIWVGNKPEPEQMLGDARTNAQGAIFHPDGRHLASYSEIDSPQLWNVVTGTVSRRFGQLPATSLAFNSDGSRIAAALRDDYTIRLWDTETGEELRDFKGHAGQVKSVTFSPNGKRLASLAGDGTLRLWDVESGAQVYQRDCRGSKANVAFSADGHWLATADQTTLLLLDARPAGPDEKMGRFWAAGIKTQPRSAADVTKLIPDWKNAAMRQSALEYLQGPKSP